MAKKPKRDDLRIDRAFELHGVVNWPTPGEHSSCVLSYEPGQRLELRVFTPQSDAAGIDAAMNAMFHAEQKTETRISGQLADIGGFTAIDCWRGEGTLASGIGASSQFFVGDVVFDTCAPISEIRADEIHIYMEPIGVWLGTTAIKRPLPERGERRSGVIEFGWSPKVELGQSSDGVSLCAMTAFQSSGTFHSEGRCSFEYAFVLRRPSGYSVAEARDEVFALQQLLTVLWGKPSIVQAAQLVVGKRTEPKTWIYSATQREDIKPAGPFDLLLPYGLCKGDWATVWQRWIELRPKLDESCSLLTSLQLEKTKHLSKDLVTAAQAIESLARNFNMTDPNPAQRKKIDQAKKQKTRSDSTLSEKLQRLVGSLPSPIREHLGSDLQRMAASVVGCRNYLAHRNPKQVGNDLPNQAKFDATIWMEWIHRFFVLNQLGVSPSLIESRLAHHPSFSIVKRFVESFDKVPALSAGGTDGQPTTGSAAVGDRE